MRLSEGTLWVGADALVDIGGTIKYINFDMEKIKPGSSDCLHCAISLGYPQGY